MEQKDRKKHERQESAFSSRRNGFSNCFSCRSYSSNTSFVLLVLLSVQNFPTESLIVHTADLSALIRINLSREGRQEAGRAVGARAAGSGWEGLEGNTFQISARCRGAIHCALWDASTPQVGAMNCAPTSIPGTKPTWVSRWGPGCGVGFGLLLGDHVFDFVFAALIEGGEPDVGDAFAGGVPELVGIFAGGVVHLDVQAAFTQEAGEAGCFFA